MFGPIFRFIRSVVFSNKGSSIICFMILLAFSIATTIALSNSWTVVPGWNSANCTVLSEENGTQVTVKPSICNTTINGTIGGFYNSTIIPCFVDPDCEQFETPPNTHPTMKYKNNTSTAVIISVILDLVFGSMIVGLIALQIKENCRRPIRL